MNSKEKKKYKKADSIYGKDVKDNKGSKQIVFNRTVD
jgi:hypothetical protein